MRKKRKISIVSITILLYLIAAIVLFLLYYGQDFNSSLYFSLSLALSLNFLNYLCALVLFTISVKKSNKTFLIYNFGGMVVRMFLMLGAVIISIKTLKIDQYAFIFTFLVFYFISLLGEIVYFHKKQLKNNTA